ncbi:MAG: bifunctional glycosyltransferase family 2/GtrA family protein [Oscillospiraceae bacterium]|jgi:glycosyltransferase involved in cell wall biosynthesis|nr:bifunctional glycosyltransferase family 2/GtrA family protein [Oscillospiraceae bacterium]
MKIAAIVPSLNPDEHMCEVVRELAAEGLRVFVVDDGSGPAYAPFFAEAAAIPGCSVLRHDENKGKGRALKTAFAAFLDECPDWLGVVTADADGQHAREDVMACARALLKNPDALIIGGRNFSQQDVPLRSMLGNRITSGVFRFLCGIEVTDTQTGLRAIPREFCRILKKVPGERYEFETNMLLEAGKHHIPIVEVPISTVYIQGNASSHFNPLKDSIRIYGLILKFLSASLISFFIDIALFALLNRLLWGMDVSLRILASTAGARVCSSLVNFFMNRSFVFSSERRLGSSMGRYYLLCACQLLFSFLGVNFLVQALGFLETPSKLLVDILLMLLSFSIQRAWVFKEDAQSQAGG